MNSTSPGPLYPNEAQARRYLVYWQILVAQKRNADRAREVAAGYLVHLDPAVAEALRAEFKFS
jgi:hypothetical protein